jgi:Flp pilus assembly pilin Flp
MKESTMNTLRKLLSRKLVTDQRGLTTVEYVIALGLIAAVAVGSWKTFGDMVHGHLDKAKTNIDTPLTTAETSATQTAGKP